LRTLAEEERTMIFYESPMRLVKTLEEFIQVFGEERHCSVSRELTKMFEENKRGTLKEVCEYFKLKTVKGEIVIVVHGKN
jgi:16S rRNA (cytidine1402-2'-O)-methyltransferase